MSTRFLRLFAVLACLCVPAAAWAERITIDIMIPPGSPIDLERAERVYIRTVEDKRVFQDSTTMPDKPSWDAPETESSESGAKRVVGRTWGEGEEQSSNVVLAEPQSVESIVLDVWKSELQRRGYVIVQDESQVGRGGVVLDIYINRFWAHGKRRFAPIIFLANMETLTLITRDGSSKRVLMKTEGRNSGLTQSSENYERAFERAMRAYMDQLEEELSGTLFDFRP